MSRQSHTCAGRGGPLGSIVPKSDGFLRLAAAGDIASALAGAPPGGSGSAGASVSGGVVFHRSGIAAM